MSHRDTTGNTRRRRNPPTPTYGSDFNQSLHSTNNENQRRSSGDGGGQQKSREGKRSGRYFSKRRKAHFSKLSNMCSKFGSFKLRPVDIIFIIALSVKLISFLYSWGSSKSVSGRKRGNDEQPHISTINKVTDPTLSESSSSWILPKWVENWKHDKMPFFSPMLYQRGDDQYRYDYESILDDDGLNMPPGHSNEKTQYKGMFRGSTYKHKYQEDYQSKKRQVNRRGYAFVDDAIYNSNTARHRTSSALKVSTPILNHDMIVPRQRLVNVGAFDVLHEDGTAPHYIDDDSKYDVYYAFDDDFVRGTHGMGLWSEYKENEASLHDDEWHEHKEDEEEEVIPEEVLHPRGYDAWHENEGVEETVCTRPTFYRGNHPTCNEIHAQVSGYTWLLGEEVYSRRWKHRKQLSKENALLSKFLGAGYFRHAFLLERIVARDHSMRTNEEGVQNEWDDVVFKIMQQLEHDEGDGFGFSEDDEVRDAGWGYNPADKYTYLGLIEYMRIDSNVMDVLTPSSRITNIFSYCGTSSITEFTPIDIEDYVYPTMGNTPKKLQHEPDEFPYMDLPLNSHISYEEKLEICLEMAKCLAAMHGHVDGPIVNVDVQLGQFFRLVLFCIESVCMSFTVTFLTHHFDFPQYFRGKDGKIKLVDFNRAEPMLYNTKKEEYCKWRNGLSEDMSLRAPEETVDAGLNEQVDVFSLGNVFYSVLTGE